MKKKTNDVKPTKMVTYLDEEGKRKYDEALAQLKAKYNEILARKCEGPSYYNGVDTQVDEVRMSKLMEARLIENEIRELEELLNNAIIINHLNDESVIDIGDVVLLHDVEYNEDFSAKLVAGFPQTIDNIQEISINSLLGKAIFGKKVGDTVSYKAPSGNVEMIIVEKLNNNLTK